MKVIKKELDKSEIIDYNLIKLSQDKEVMVNKSL